MRSKSSWRAICDDHGRPELHQLRDAVGILLNRAFRPAILQTQILSLDITELMEPLP